MHYQHGVYFCKHGFLGSGAYKNAKTWYYSIEFYQDAPYKDILKSIPYLPGVLYLVKDELLYISYKNRYYTNKQKVVRYTIYTENTPERRHTKRKIAWLLDQ